MNTGQIVRFKCWECLVFFDLSLVGTTEVNVGEQELAKYQPSGCPYCGSPDIKAFRDEPVADAPLLVSPSELLSPWSSRCSLPFGSPRPGKDGCNLFNGRHRRVDLALVLESAAALLAEPRGRCRRPRKGGIAVKNVIIAGVVIWAIAWPVVSFVACWLIFRRPDPQPQPRPLQIVNFAEADEQARKSAARVQVRTLTMAVDTYSLQHKGELPDNLAVLLRAEGKGIGPYLKDDRSLVDPWNQPYQFDRNGTRNGGQQPDIWTTAPDGTEIGNWRRDKSDQRDW